MLDGSTKNYLKVVSGLKVMINVHLLRLILRFTKYVLDVVGLEISPNSGMCKKVFAFYVGGQEGDGAQKIRRVQYKTFLELADPNS